MQKYKHDNQVKKNTIYTYQYDDEQIQLYKPKRGEQRVDQTVRNSVSSKSSYTVLSEKQNQQILKKNKSGFMNHSGNYGNVNNRQKKKKRDEIMFNLQSVGPIHNVETIKRDDRNKKIYQEKNKKKGGKYDANLRQKSDSQNQSLLETIQMIKKKNPNEQSEVCEKKKKGANNKRSNTLINKDKHNKNKVTKKLKKSKSKKKMYFKEKICNELEEESDQNHNSLSNYSNESELSNYYENIDPEKIVQKNINEKNKR